MQWLNITSVWIYGVSATLSKFILFFEFGSSECLGHCQIQSPVLEADPKVREISQCPQGNFLREEKARLCQTFRARGSPRFGCGLEVVGRGAKSIQDHLKLKNFTTLQGNW